MPRVRADDYDDKKTAILDAAASLFAEYGYAGSKMEDIAERCGVSKSMLYHYFKKKEDVLFDMLQQHVLSIVDELESFLATHPDTTDPDESLRGFVEAYLTPKAANRARHVVALHDMRYLTDEQKRKQVQIERDVVNQIQAMLARIEPKRSDQELRVYALLLVGMLNWIELWYSRSGKISPPELYGRVSSLFLHGFQVPASTPAGAVKKSKAGGRVPKKSPTSGETARHSR